ncbi:MAG: T9SS type A sorting domain-containing protein [Bacteroidota bacterium]
MKKHLLLSLSVLALATTAIAQPTVTVQDSIAVDTHWTNNQQYMLMGYVYVTAGHTLTIDAGCIIKGDKNSKGSLIVERGAKIYANGTAAEPIVFTSSQPMGQRSYGDWGGIILCGYAPTNWTGGTSQVEGGPRSFYGGSDAHDNSGSMSYVRIEFPGIAFSPNNEINGLTFCGVGDATHIDHIQVSYSGDDSYEWFGGNVNAKYIVAYAGWDDDFDTDNGYQGKNQFCVGIRDPFAADQSGSKGFESDSYQGTTYSGLPLDATKVTKPVFSNCTMIGPLVSPTSTAFDPQFVSGAHIRRGSSISILNSIIAGYPCGILIDESAAAYGSTTGNIINDELQIHNTIVCGIPTNMTPSPKELLYVKDGARSLTSTSTSADTTTGSPFGTFPGPFSWFYNPSSGNKIYSTEQTGVRLQSPFDLANPNLVPTSTSPICYNATHTFHPLNPLNPDTSNSYANYNMPAMPPSFTTGKANDPFFTVVNYVGAFSGTGTTNDNWMNGWCNFDPVNTDYSHVNTGVLAQATVATPVVKVFPNPAKQVAHIAVELKQASHLTIYVTDITGKIVADVINSDNVTGSHSFTVDLSTFTAGMYFVSVATDNLHKSYKLNVIK